MSTTKRINIYINLILIIIIITIIILLGIFSCPCVLSGRCVPGGSSGLLKLSQPGSYWQAGKYWERCRRRSGAGGSSLLRITAVSVALYFCENNGISAGQRRQFLTTHIENVIISVTMITKMLLVTRAPNLRCKAFLPFAV